ncbi:hypothetical protein [Bradyrhizobium sp. AZCC 2230]|uniref:hypothetical protein n=1 Tax=Bradyrhizobium sp. AZCC 2230 TaxID=3117021 RepID=UPI002FF2E05F
MSIDWRPARSLEVLLKQVNDMAPGRDKSSDGILGDQSHQTRKSDHNPDANGVVTAMDISHDPAHGVDAGDLAETLRQSQDKRIKYIISNRRIASSVVSPWQWRPYNGANAHEHHVHVSVMDTPSLYDDTSAWQIDPNLMRRAKIFPEAAAGSTSRCINITATVFGGSADRDEKSAYDGHRIDDVELGVALPSRFSGPRPQVRVTNRANGKSVVCNIVDVGPWNIRDPYWEKGARPQAESGTDLTGRRTNGAGIDLTPGAARAIGVPGKGVVDWEFVGAVQGPQATPEAALPILVLLQKIVKDGAIKMPLPADDVSAILQQLFKFLQGQNAAPGPASPTPAPVPAADPSAQIIDLIAKIIVPALSKQIPQLGQVNGALGQTIGELLNGKKTALGIFGSLASWLAPIIGSSGLFGGAGMAAGLGGAGAGGLALVPQIGVPIFIAMTLWGILGKIEKWNQGNVPLSLPPK